MSGAKSECDCMACVPIEGSWICLWKYSVNPTLVNFGWCHHHPTHPSKHWSERLWKSSRVHAGLQRRRQNSYQFIIQRAENKWFRTCLMSFSSSPLLKGLQVPSVRCGSSQPFTGSVQLYPMSITVAEFKFGECSYIEHFCSCTTRGTVKGLGMANQIPWIRKNTNNHTFFKNC